ncbi:group II truncated hemoglobin [bacterium]|nr:MAG: group II truncated hemoglobin [bacterium]
MNEIALNQIGALYHKLGEDAIQNLVNRFYDIMDSDPNAAGIRAMHKNLDASREKLFKFLIGRFGGPPLYVEKYGHPMLRAKHAPFSIGTAERDQWLSCMQRAMDDCIGDKELIPVMKDFFVMVADSMRNKTE